LELKDYEDLIAKHAGSTSEKQYNKINKDALLREFWFTLPNDEYGDADIVKMEYSILEEVITPVKVVYGQVLGVATKTNCIRFMSYRTLVEGWIMMPKGVLPKKGDSIILNGLEQKRANGKKSMFAKHWEEI
ncbi:MAG: hypothetical protein ACRC0V_07740, partial [Fusobacteriaceae bacterium]